MSQLKSPHPGKVLVICEKPSVAAELLKALGGGKMGRDQGYHEFEFGWITWGYGHLVELVKPPEYNPDWKQWRWETLPMVPEDYRFRYVPSQGKDGGKGTRAQLNVISKLLKQADALVNAADAGREGELIFWEAAKFAGWGADKPAAVPGPLPTYRLWTNAMTAEGLREAWNTMKPISAHLPLARAAYCRSESDWLLGLNLSRAATLSFPRSWGSEKTQSVDFWTVGRVQTPLLAIIVRRDLSIENFVSKTFYEVRLTFQDAKTPSNGEFETVLRVPAGFKAFEASQVGEGEGGGSGDKATGFSVKEEAESVMSAILGNKSIWDVADTSTPGTENPPGLFDLTDLQRWCNQAWGWSAQQTLEAAQEAYETDKTLTYPRTSSAFLPEDSMGKMDQVHRDISQKWVASQIGNLGSLPLFSPSKAPRAGYLFNSAKVSDHFAIVPTGVIPSNVSSPSGMLWVAVVRRFFSAFSAPAKTNTVRRTVTLDKGQADERVAVCSGKVYLDRGWFAVDEAFQPLTGGSSRRGADRVLAVCGKEANVVDGRLHEGFTSPPRAFDEASLLAVMANISAKLVFDEEGEMDIEALKDAVAELGLGTPATRAEIIERLIHLGYIVRGGKAPVPKQGRKGAEKEAKAKAKYVCATDAGRRLIASLEEIKLDYLTEPLLTAQWEKRLQDMAEGSKDDRESFLGDLVTNIKASVDIFQKNAKVSPPTPKVEPKETAVLCPKSGKPVMDCGNYYMFPGTPEKRYWKEVCKRPMTPEDYVPLVENGKTEVLSGFIGAKTGKEFSTMLVFKGEKMEFEFPPREGVTEGVPLEGITCPKSKKPVLDKGKFFFFPGKPKVCFWKEISQRKMHPKEYVALVEKGKLPGVTGFISKAGKEFTADLVLKADKVSFDFGKK